MSAGDPATPLMGEEARYRSCPVCRAAFYGDLERCTIDGSPIESSSTDLLVGSTLGDYVLDEGIGEGGMGRVYRAHHARLVRRRVAVKVLFGDLTSSPSSRERFVREAEAASRLDHPNVVRMLDVGRTDRGLIYLVMELANGPTLLELIEQHGPITAPRTVALARQIALGLVHAHDHGLVHRDLKPANVVIERTEQGEVARIVDFGLAISTTPGEHTRLTSKGFSIGSPSYMAPEQVSSGGAVDGRADIFALGVTMYEMLAGVLPFDGTVLEVLKLNSGGDPPAIALRSGVEVPPALEQLVRRLMASERGGRPPSVRKLIAELDALPLPRPAATDKVPLEPARRRRPLALVAVGVAVAALAFVLARLVLPGHPLAPTAPTPSPTAQLAPAPPLTPELTRTAVPSTTAVAVADVVSGADLPPLTTSEGAGPARRHAARPRGAAHNPQAGREPRVATSARPAPPADAVTAVAPPPHREAPPPAPVVAVVAKPVLPRAARARIAALDVDGGLADSEIRRAVEHVLPGVRACYLAAVGRAQRAPTATVTLAFTIGESRRPRSLTSHGGELAGLADCVASQVRGVHTDVAPDVGEVQVSLGLELSPVTP